MFKQKSVCSEGPDQKALIWMLWVTVCILHPFHFLQRRTNQHSYCSPVVSFGLSLTSAAIRKALGALVARLVPCAPESESIHERETGSRCEALSERKSRAAWEDGWGRQVLVGCKFWQCACIIWITTRPMPTSKKHHVFQIFASWCSAGNMRDRILLGHQLCNLPSSLQPHLLGEQRKRVSGGKNMVRWMTKKCLGSWVEIAISISCCS